MINNFWTSCPKEGIGMTIKEARIEAGLSRAEMSRQLEIPIRTIENWESGTRTPSPWVEKLVINALKNLKNN